ncbi:hypothetical protein U879_03505 [Defluviimonas sp. 20V17]|nr:hypothetical protein U879_03505 [Defluviimonas sp. 20V17]SDX57317.1 Heparinase II/III N-terminus [Allgaiera indica]
MEIDRWRLPAMERWLTAPRLARRMGYRELGAAWTALAQRPFNFVTDRAAADAFMGEVERAEIIERAERAMRREIELLGSGPIRLGTPVDWHLDPKVGRRWPPQFCRRIEYSNRGEPSDVKMPWEISRLQWLIPVGQAYAMTKEERFADFARDVLNEWIAQNPTGYSVNWSCTMEPALRILTWVWLFHVFAGSASWADTDFRSRFLRALYMHGVFVERHIERGRVNGNHYTADAAGMVWAGLFFDGTTGARSWAETGWRILESEIVLQVHPDGVDFEASSAYHRLVAELFWIAAHYRAASGAMPSPVFADRLRAMAEVTRHLCRNDGTTPHWGDNDDARALPFGLQPLDDHRYLPDLIDLTLGTRAAMTAPPECRQEVHWVFGARPAETPPEPGSRGFRDGGLFVMRDARSHVTIDCGPIGLGGLGGHGHNDALSFEMWQDGQELIVDPGSYVYTADFEARNRFRFTASHNTPQVGGAEINRPWSDDDLWHLHDDAQAESLLFEDEGQLCRFAGRHQGYRLLSPGITIERHITLDRQSGTLAIEDRFEASGPVSGEEVTIPFHLAPRVAATLGRSGVLLVAGDVRRLLRCTLPGQARLTIEDAEVSPSYGVCQPSKKVVLRVPLEDGLVVQARIEPAP